MVSSVASYQDLKSLQSSEYWLFTLFTDQLSCPVQSCVQTSTPNNYLPSFIRHSVSPIRYLPRVTAFFWMASGHWPAINNIANVMPIGFVLAPICFRATCTNTPHRYVCTCPAYLRSTCCPAVMVTATYNTAKVTGHAARLGS